MAFEHVTQNSLVEQVEDQLLANIHSGKYSPGTSLPSEQELSERMKVSRSVVREGLSRLKALGLIESKKKKGMLVTSPKDFGKLGHIVHPAIMAGASAKAVRELRIVIEVGLADILFMRKTDEDIADLDRLAVEGECAKDKSREERIELDIKFHKRLYAATHNPMLIQLQDILLRFFEDIKRLDKRYINRELPFEATHAGLVEILKSGTVEQFRTAMKKHLKVFFDIDNDESKHE